MIHVLELANAGIFILLYDFDSDNISTLNAKFCILCFLYIEHFVRNSILDVQNLIRFDVYFDTTVRMGLGSMWDITDLKLKTAVIPSNLVINTVRN